MSEYKYLDENGLIYYHSKIKTILSGKVDKENGKGLSTNDYTTTEKNKLNGIASGAEVNQNAFSNIAVGSTTIAADSKTDTLTIVAGNNITLTPNATSDTLTIAADAEPITIDDALDSTSENPVQNKVIATALDTKIGRNDYAELNSDNGGTIRINSMFKTMVGDTGKYNGCLEAMSSTEQEIWSANPSGAKFASLQAVQLGITSHIDTSLSDSSDDVHYPSSKCVYDAINDAIGSITGISFEVVQELPQTGETGTIYLVPNSGSAPNIYDEYIWIASTSKFEKIGTTDVDLSGYVQKTEMVTITNAEIDTIVA